MSRTTTPAASLISQALRHVPLFAGLPQESCECLSRLENGTIRDVEKGTWLVRAGEVPAFTVLITGRAVEEPFGHVLCGPVHFGAVELINGTASARSVRADIACSCFILEEKHFLAALSECGVLARRLLVDIARRT